MSVNFADYSYMSKKYQESQKALEKAVKVRNDATLEASKHIENNIKLQKEIVTLTARIAELEAERKWIPVSERLPEVEVNVLAAVYDASNSSVSMQILKHHGEGKWFFWDTRYYVVTHWMPLPEPPEVQE